MKFSFILLFFLTLVAGWSAIDQEIFKVNHELTQDLGSNTTFYTWLNLTKGPKSSLDDINKAYRKLSRKIHPDKIKPNKFRNNMKKFKKVKKLATQRYQRLSVVGEILRNTDKRKRYDYFVKNGFPVYKNNNWFYEKFRPSFLMVIVGLIVIISIFQYILSKLQHVQNQKRINEMIYEIKGQAWPNGMPPMNGNDRVLRNEMINKTFVVKTDGSVFIQDENDKDMLFKLDPNDTASPSIFNTLLFKIFIGLNNSTLGKISSNLMINWGKFDEIKKYDNRKIYELNEDELKEEEEKTKKSKNKNKKLGEKVVLPNGKTIRARKKN